MFEKLAQEISDINTKNFHVTEFEILAMNLLRKEMHICCYRNLIEILLPSLVLPSFTECGIIINLGY